MRNTQPLFRSAPVAAVAAALACGLAAHPAAAGPGISVSTSGRTVSVTTSACTLVDGSWGTASLLTSSQTSFTQGRQVALTGTKVSQSAAWQSISPGTYTVIVVCANNITAGSQSVIVSGSSTPTISATSKPAPSRGVMGGEGGGTKDYGPLTFALGGSLVAVAMIATGWVLRRRSKPYRL
ncbi:hypothetical protein [Streptomyces naganishii]|uniref:hypothetical protein n=1 Tax=Streptomyces naganishii TaxID=285447 RepID=UPI00167F19D7|nr:hypothetical protein [Streptomyces naganishii]